MYKVLAVFALLFSLNISFGQELERARDLVETMRQKMTMPHLDTIEVKVNQTDLRTGQSNTIEQFYDLKNQRVFSMAFDGNGEKNNETTFENGHLKTSLRLEGEVTAGGLFDNTTPTALRLIAMFSSLLQEYRVFLPKEYTILSYDGMVQYGDIVKGEQVTLSFEDARRGGEQVTVSYIFTAQGELVGAFFSGSSPYLSVHEVFGFDDYLRIKTKTYAIDGQTAYPVHEIREDYRFNRSVDQTSFATW